MRAGMIFWGVHAPLVGARVMGFIAPGDLIPISHSRGIVLSHDIYASVLGCRRVSITLDKSTHHMSHRYWNQSVGVAYMLRCPAYGSALHFCNAGAQWSYDRAYACAPSPVLLNVNCPRAVGVRLHILYLRQVFMRGHQDFHKKRHQVIYYVML